jgi:transcriptional regulator with XRE-family HTH domain
VWTTLAQKIGTTPMSVIYWRTGRRKPSFAHAAALEKLFGFPLTRLLTAIIDLPIAPAGDYHVLTPRLPRRQAPRRQQ